MVREALKFYIGGEWVLPETPKTMDVINPATESVMGVISIGDKADVDKAVKAARAAFDGWNTTPVADRIAMMEKLLALYKTRWDEMATVITEEMGSPISKSKSSQVGAGFGQMHSALEAAKTFVFEDHQSPRIIQREGIGVCGLITPWNWPINQVGAKVAPALLAGNTLVLKPSEIAPFDAVMLAEMIDEVGFPAGVFNLVNGDGPGVGEAMSSHPDIDMMSFTGSTRAGTAIAAAAAATVKRVAQELGGKSANIILDDDDFEKNVARDAFGVMMNTGQTCVAGTRMLVPQHRMDEAGAIAAKAVATIQVGDPKKVDTQMGPQVSEVQWSKVQDLIQQGIDEGAKLVAGGTGKPEGLNMGYYSRPTVFIHVNNDMIIAREEIFGPVLSILGYETTDEAVDIANDSPYGLAAYVSGTDQDKAINIARRLKAGQITVNDPDWDMGAPFGGYKQSGNGREGSHYGLEDFLETKAIMAPGL